MPALKVILQEIALLGDEYVINNSGYQWRAAQLLRWLHQHYPDDLELQVQFVRQGLAGDGAIYEVDRDGEMVSSMPLYWVDRCSAPGQIFNLPPPEESAYQAQP